MTPLERIRSEGDAWLKLTASWELVELEDGPHTRAGNELSNKFVDFQKCLFNMVVLHLLAISEDLSVEAVNTSYFAPPVVKQTFQCHQVNIYCYLP